MGNHPQEGIFFFILQKSPILHLRAPPTHHTPYSHHSNIYDRYVILHFNVRHGPLLPLLYTKRYGGITSQ
jgi:hypothetical protein